MTVRDWITSPKEWGDWGTRANAWFNEIAAFARSNNEAIAANDVDIAALGVEIDDAVADYNAHISNADWLNSGLTFSRSTTSGGTRIADDYSTTREVYVGGTRHTFSSGTDYLEYDSTGSQEIYRLDRTDRRMEHHSGARLNGAANYYSGWQNYGGGWADGWWFRMPDGEVIWEGLVRRTGSTSGTSAAFILTNGSGRQTRSQQIHVTQTSLGAGRVDSFSNGQLVYQGTGIPVNGWISLAGIRYLDDWR